MHFSLPFLLLLLCAHAEGKRQLETIYYDQTIDHFNWKPTEPTTYKQRVIIDRQWWKNETSPIFFYTGNEAQIWDFVNNTGFQFTLAEEFGALVVFAEHRYYGESLPFGQKAYEKENIIYLTVEQAMADFAELIAHLKESNKAPHAPVITFGGSYGANLAMWMRLKYPNLVYGGFASSATPLKHILRETNNFYKIVTEVYHNVSSKCPDICRSAWKEIFAKAKTSTGRASLTHSLRLCSPMTAENQAWSIYYYTQNALEGMAQYGYPYPANFIGPMPGYPFKKACQDMVKAPNNIAALKAAWDVAFNYTGTVKCFKLWSPEEPAEEALASPEHIRQKHHRHHHDGGISANSGIAWSFQTCTEVYQPMPTNGITDMFLPYTPNNTAIFDGCRSRWGVTPRPKWEELHFWGSALTAGTNLILTNGQVDPWRSAGIQWPIISANNSVFVHTITGAAHHLDLRTPNKLDPPSVTETREKERKIIGAWLDKWYNGA